MEISSGYPDGVVRTTPLRKFLIELFSKQNAMQANPLNQRRVGAEKALAFETPTEGGHGWSDDRIQWGVSVYNPKTTS